MRNYIRHPSDVPLEYKLEDMTDHSREYLKDISHGGLAFSATRCLDPGTVIDVKIPVREPAFEAEGVVVWCIPSDEKGKFDVGVRFIGDHNDYRLRMVEQVSHIEHYKREVRQREGRELTGEQAAVEWIRNYAGGFPHIEGE